IVSQSGTQGSPYQITIVQYVGSQSSLTAVTFLFQGGILSSKGQIGLDTVTQFIGNAGNVASETGTGNVAAVSVQYKVVGTVIGTVNLIFSGGKLYIKTGFGFK
ncbi:unnamed protein product, partial [Rotaria sordida]